MKAVFPKYHIKPLYYKIHIQYVIEFFRYLGYEISFAPCTSDIETAFAVILDDVVYAVDFSDYQELSIPNRTNHFKFHLSDETLKNNPTIQPFSPVSFYDWNEYYKLQTEIKYTCNNDIVLNMQRPHTQNFKRRTYVQTMLKNRYEAGVKTKLSTPVEFWKEINNCLVSVCVPGARNDIIDRGQLQQMAFGCCTISPNITDVFPGGVKLEPNFHYIQCRDDYSDLIDIIEHCKNHRTFCLQVGHNAKQFFFNHCTPEAFAYLYA